MLRKRSDPGFAQLGPTFPCSSSQTSLLGVQPPMCEWGRWSCPRTAVGGMYVVGEVRGPRTSLRAVVVLGGGEAFCGSHLLGPQQPF